MTTIEAIKNECQGWTGLQSGTPQGQFAQRSAKALLDLIAYVEEDLAYPPLNLRAREKLETIRRTWEESK